MGEASLQTRFSPHLAKIDELANFVSTYAPHIHDSDVDRARQSFDQIAGAMEGQAAHEPPQYIQQSQSFLNSIQGQLYEAQKWKMPFVVAALEVRGFLSDESIRDENQKAIAELKQASADTLKTIQEEASKSLTEAKRLAEEIETRARKTATKISVEAAQVQFKEAGTALDKRVRIWAIASAVAIVGVVGLAVGFMSWHLPPSTIWTEGLYHTLLRILVLAAVASSAAFSFKMLRAHMHMAEKSRHRVRVANSVESFVNSAIEPQQRDLILAKLAAEVIEFGDSGLIASKGDDADSPMMSADLLGRILAGMTRR